MVYRFAIVIVLASLAIANGASLSSHSNTNIIPIENKERLIKEVPLIGAVVLKSLRVAWFLISSAFSLIGWKLTALACAVNALFWIFNKSFSVIIGAVAMLGFCKLTDKCSLNYVPQELVQVGETLVWAARSLEDGAMKYAGENKH